MREESLIEGSRAGGPSDLGNGRDADRPLGGAGRTGTADRLSRIDPEQAAARLEADLEEYSLIARRSGASDVKIVDTGDIVVDERVYLKCSVPLCFGYGTSANCPPYSLRPQETRTVLQRYHKALVFKLDVSPEVIVRDRETITERVAAYQTVFRVVSAIESAAFYDGHYLAAGFAAGSCKSTFCHKVDCAVLAGDKCRHSLVARPSMESVGIDCFALAYRLGWDIYPVGSSASPDSVPGGTLMGIVLVA